MRKMNKESLENTLKKLLIENDRTIIASISGDWGVGKTYFWQYFAKNNLMARKLLYIFLCLARNIIGIF